MICEVCNKPIKRTHAQNKYWWVSLGIISKALNGQYTPEQLNYLIKKTHGWGEEFAIKKTGEIVFLPSSTADWNKGEFAERTDLLIQWAATYGIEILSPEQFYAEKDTKQEMSMN